MTETFCTGSSLFSGFLGAISESTGRGWSSRGSEGDDVISDMGEYNI